MRRYLYYIDAGMASIRVTLQSCLLIYITSTTSLNAGEIRLPSLGGDYSASILSPEQEHLLGESFMRSLREQITFYNEPVIQHYIQTLGERLVTQSEVTSKDFEFFVIDNPAINAFAGPDGKIGVHTGLIEKAKNEGELAAVLAHEIAHVTQRHLMRMLESQQDMSLPIIATVLATVIAASADPQAGQAIAATTTGLSIQKQINFTRSNEQEADRAGMKILHSAGYSPSSMPAFFERLQQANRYSGESLPEYLQTHPLIISRIADAESRAARFSQQKKTDTLEFNLIRQMLLVNSFKNPQHAIRQYETKLQQIVDPLAIQHHQFGYGVALLKSGQPTKAIKQFSQLLEQNPGHPILITTISHAHMENGNISEALKTVEDTHQLYPSYLPLTYLLADLLISSGENDQAIRMLEQHISTSSTTPELYQKLAIAYRSADQPVKSHIAQAQYHFFLGETESALSQLDYAERAAKNGRGNFILFSTIDAHRLIYEEKEEREGATIAD